MWESIYLLNLPADFYYLMTSLHFPKQFPQGWSKGCLRTWLSPQSSQRPRVPVPKCTNPQPLPLMLIKLFADLELQQLSKAVFWGRDCFFTRYLFCALILHSAVQPLVHMVSATHITVEIWETSRLTRIILCAYWGFYIYLFKTSEQPPLVPLLRKSKLICWDLGPFPLSPLYSESHMGAAEISQWQN